MPAEEIPPPQPDGDLMEQMLDRALRGEALDIDALLAERPGLEEPERARLRAAAEDLAPDSAAGCDGSGAVSSVSTAEREARAAPSALFGHYEILGELGRGAQGTVFLARDTRLARRVALKVLNRADLLTQHDSPRGGPAMRLRREAEIASKLDHPGICTVYEMGVVDGRPFIAMRYVEGETLAKKIAAAREEQRALRAAPLSEHGDGKSEASNSSTSRREIVRIVELVERIARALDAAHKAHVIHRDLKPANVMITPAGEPVILDFGLARDAESDGPTLTATGEVFGSPAYMSPEQIDPQRGALDLRADVYSLGVVLYECLTLRRPFDSPTREGLYRAILGAPPPDARAAQPTISRDLAVVLATALEKQRDRRYQSAFDFAEELRRIRQHEPILARPAGPALRLRRWSQRNPVLATAILGVFVVMLATIVGLQAMLAREQGLRQEAEAHRLLAESAATLAKDPALALQHAIESSEVGSPLEAKLNDRLIEGLLALRETRRRTAHGKSVTDAQLSADGSLLVTCGTDLSVRLWDGRTWEPLGELPKHAGAPRISLSADGGWLATISDTDPPRLWSTTTRTARTFDMEQHAALLVLAPDGQRAAHLTSEAVEVLRVDDGLAEERVVLGQHTLGTYSDLKWSPDSRWLLVTQSEGLRLCRVAPKGVDRRWFDRGGPIRPSGGFSGTAASLAVVPTAIGVTVFDLVGGLARAAFALPPEGNARRVLHARIDPRGARILVIYRDRGAEVLDARDGRVLAKLFAGRSGVTTGEFSDDGSMILLNNSIACETASGNVLAEFASTDPTTTIAVAQPGVADAPWITFHRSGMMRCWSLTSRVPRAQIELHSEMAPGARGCDAVGDRLAIGGRSQVRVYSLTDLEPLGELTGNGDRVAWVDMSADGRWIATAAGATARVWSTATWSESRPPLKHERIVYAAEFSPDSRWLATAGEEGRIRLFEVDGADEPAFELPSNRRGLRSLRFDPTGARLVSVSEMEGVVRVWDIAERREVAACPVGPYEPAKRTSAAPRSACFHPDGARVVITTYDGRVLLWDTRDDSKVDQELGGALTDCDYAADAKLVAVGSSSGDVYLLGGDDLRVVARLPGQGLGASSVCFARGGLELVSQDGSDTVRVWPVDLLAAARDALHALDSGGGAAR